MSFIPQFLGMRERHDEHSKLLGHRTVMGSTWSDCDTCLAIAAWDEIERMIEDLTPGGSEFYREPARCVAQIRARLDRLMERSKDLTQAKRDLDHALNIVVPKRDARILELEEQLRNCRHGKTLVKRERDALRVRE